MDMVGVRKNISRTKKEEIFKYSAIPPHTPKSALSTEDFINFFFINTPCC